MYILTSIKLKSRKKQRYFYFYKKIKTYKSVAILKNKIKLRVI